MIVAEATPFTSAITGVPLIGGLASQVLVVLYQIPVVNVVLSPIIGKSQKTDIVDRVEPVRVRRGDPIAFTVMVPSTDGVMISTNYFPATSVVTSGGTDEAPTILNGPGLATAGNIDPSAPNTVDGLVPGINTLRNAGLQRRHLGSARRVQLHGTGWNSTHLNTKARTLRTSSTWVADNRSTPSRD